MTARREGAKRERTNESLDELTEPRKQRKCRVRSPSPFPARAGPMHTAQALPDAMRAQPRGCARRCAACRLLPLLALSASPPHSSLRCTARTTRRQCRSPCRACATSGAADGGPGDGLRVVVLGGGFGGLYAALRLNGLPWPQGKEPQVRGGGVYPCCPCLPGLTPGWHCQVTLVDQSSRFVFKPLMYELLMGDLSTDEAREAPRHGVAGRSHARRVRDRCLGHTVSEWCCASQPFA